MPTNSENLSGFFGMRESIVMASRLPTNIFDVATAAGVPHIADFETVTDPGALDSP